MSQKAVGNDRDPPVKKGDGGYADWVIVALHSLREYLDHTYRQLMDVLHEMPRIVEELGLTAVELPDFTTVCNAKQAIKMLLWRVLLRLSTALHDFGEVQAIDATGFGRRAVSRHYGKRIHYYFQAIKTTALVDCETGAIIDIHCSIKQPHDSQIGWQVLTRNLDQLETIVADKGYYWYDLRHKLREHGVRPVIKHSEFYHLDKAHNARMDDDGYHLRSNVETAFFAIKHSLCSVGRPQSNGKIERFFQTYEKQRWRFKSLEAFLDFYNKERPHMSLTWDELETPYEAYDR